MLHDAITDRTTDLDANRRASPRVSCPAELVIAWLEDVATPMRYGLIDVSEGGYRIQSSLPRLTGTTGLVLRYLPSGEAVDEPVMVAWTRRGDDGRYDLGLRRL